jgi:hypothetical protein
VVFVLLDYLFAVEGSVCHFNEISTNEHIFVVVHKSKFCVHS